MSKEDRGLIGDLDIRQIVQLVEALDRSSFDSLQLDFGHFRLTLGKGGAVTGPPASTQARPVSSSPAVTPPVAPPGARQAEKQPGGAPAAGTINVRSPIMGLFYCKPNPASPPFVSLGTEVQEGTTVGLIEVMKVYHAVQAGAKGVIAEICVEDAEMVEIGQTLFRIRPTAT